MNIYISGPISGRKMSEVFAQFGEVEAKILDAGHTPVSPTAICKWGLTWSTYMHLAWEILVSGDIDAVFMLRGWEKSNGAKLEHKWAKGRGIPIYYQGGMK